MKKCSKCETTKPASEFHKRGTKLQPMCKVCKKERSAKRYAEKGAEIRAINKKWREDNPDRMQAARDSWEVPAGYSAHHRAKGRAAQAGVHIGDLTALQKFYEECPVGYEVDHIKPLKYGGAHCVSNLQYLTVSENRRKSSKWEGSDD